MRSIGFRIGTIVLGLYFLFALVVQYNDPDPIRWMAIYLAAAGVSLAAAFRRVPPVLPLVVGAVALIWAGTLAPVVLFGRTTFAEMFRTYEMMSPQMEEGREMLGLLVVAVWMTVLAVRSRRRA